MRFKDFRVGQVIDSGPTRIEESEIIAFARANDPQWFHTDPERAASGRWQGIIASGWHTCVIAMRLACEGPLKDSESIGSPGLAYLKWPAPVRPGDELMLRVEILETRISKNGRYGVVRWRWRLLNQDEVTVVDMESTSLFDLAHGAPEQNTDRTP
jgi:acyl dehydratase